MNVALSSNGATASASSSYTGAAASGTNNGDRWGLNYGQNGTWHSSGPGFPQWLQIDFNGSKTIEEIDVFTIQDNWQYPSEPTEAMTFSLYGLSGYDVQYWNPDTSGWVTVTGGSVTGNNKVWRKFIFAAITTSKIRVWMNASPTAWSELTEVEAWTTAASPPPRTNVALSSNGATASASSSYAGAAASGTNNGDRWGLHYGQNGTWHSSGPGFPQWLQIDFNGNKTIDEIDVFTVQDNWQYPSEPTEAMTFSLYGLSGYDVQYWNGSAWVTVTGGSVTGNNKVWRKLTFAALTTSKIRVWMNASPTAWSELTEVEAWGTQSSSSGGSSPSDVAMARLDPANRTGTGGEDLLSNNFNWNLPLVGLPGRGLDLGLTLSYNSLVWTRSGNYMSFDADAGSIAPGFRLGFPTIEGPYWNPDVSANFYLFVTPSGGRVELRQVGNSIVYEAKDSSYLQLTDNLNGTMTLRPTDGSQMSFIGVSGAWRCNQIKDRNGNYISATYKSWGELETVTDTLSRVLTFNYDTNANLQSITQTWAGQVHEWATFGWGTASIGNNFPGLNNLGPNSTSIPVLTQVGLPDGSRYNFEYNNTYGMVSKIRYHASDNRLRRQTMYVAPTNAGDCPRLTERRDWAANWNGDSDENPTTSEEAITYFDHDADNGCRMTLPDGTVHKEYYGSTWQSGLTTETRSYATVADASSNLWQKKTTTAWTQDDPNVGYLTNPRVTETNVYDLSGNRRRVTIDYGAYVQWGLPYLVKEYAGDGTTELRRSQTDYDLSQAYLDRRIIGLMSTRQLYDAVTAQWQAKVTYGYDDPAKLTSQATTATKHDSSYSQAFRWRGNVTSVSRWDVTDINNSNKALTNAVSYNAAGSVVSSTDPATHTSTINYADSFADNIDRNTFAYPTTVTDADGFSSTVKYNFDFGAKTRVEGPPPQNQPNGLIQTFTYDAAARLERVTTVNTGAYTRYYYGSYYRMTFSTVNTIGDELYITEIFNGVGRRYAVSQNHPGSVGGYAAVMTIYDQMGRVAQQTNPTEITGLGVPTGDDAAGWQWNIATLYDWQGRPRKTYNMDGTFKEASYSGCGCAGGEVVTLTDEVGRRQKAYSDVLGRQWKIESLNWDGSVYSTTTNILNALDQVTLIRQWAGAENGGGAHQDTTMSYDGYGRLKTKHLPQQDAGTATVYAYNSDDTVQSVTDARNAVATYSYNSRHLVTEITYNAPAGITPTSNVMFAYDAAGNRTSMTDGSGSTSYQYNSISQMTSETRTITGVGSYTLGYGYNLASELSSITDPFNATVNYAHDSAGKLSSVTGTSFGGVSTYASNPQYRAWGALKSLDYGNSKTLSVTYNNRLLPTSYEVPGILKKSYQHNDDASLSFTQDQLTTNSKFDRSYTYDHVGRVGTALTGQEARGGAATDDRPYNESLTYDPFDNLTNLTRLNWDRADGSGPNTFVNNRLSGSSYDADGRLTSGSTGYFVHDAVGRVRTFGDDNPYKTEQEFDGNGRRVKTVARRWDETTEQWVTEKVTYYISSAVLGGAVVTELNEQGAKERTTVFAGGSVLASQIISGGNQSVQWQHYDPSGASYRGTDSTGQMNAGKEMDPLGANAGLIKPPTWNVPDKIGLPVPYPEIADMLTNPGGGCVADGVPIPCAIARVMLRAKSGTVVDNATPTAGGPPSGIITIYGRFCTTVTYQGRTQIECRDYVTDYANANLGVASGTGIPQKREGPGTIVNNSINEADRLLSKQDCWDFVHNVLGVNNPDGIPDWIRRAELVPKPNEYSSEGKGIHATATYPNNMKIEFYKPFFTETREKRLESGRFILSGPVPTEELDRSLLAQAQDTLHEGIHLWLGKGDIELANLFLKPGQKPFTDKHEASKFWHEELKKHCK